MYIRGGVRIDFILSFFGVDPSIAVVNKFNCINVRALYFFHLRSVSIVFEDIRYRYETASLLDDSCERVNSIESLFYNIAE